MQGDASFDDADLNGFVDGRIHPSRATALAASLGSDQAASARIEAWKRQNDSLRTMFASVLSEAVPVRLSPSAVPYRDTPEVTRPPRDVARLGGPLSMISLGMALVGFVAGALTSIETDGFGFAPGGSGSGNSPAPAVLDGRDPVRRAVEAHRTYLTDPARPVEMTASEEPKLTRWLQRRVGGPIRIPNFGRQGWSFLGGRIVPGRDGPAAFLAYGNGADRLGLTMSRSDRTGSDRSLAVDGSPPSLGVATWGDGDFAYALTSDRGSEWLTRNLGPLRDGMRAQVAPTSESEETARP